MLTLERPLVVLDLEATGTDPESARIIQVAARKIVPPSLGHSGVNLEFDKTTVVNPGIDVPQRILDLTGITERQIEEAAPWYEVARDLDPVLEDSDLAGYNIERYDFPLLQAEYERLNRTVPGPDERRIIDAYQLERQLRPRTLEAVYERRTGETLADAHDAEVDVKATWQILQQQADEVREADGVTPVASVLPAALEDFQRGDYLDADHKLKQTDRGVEVCFGKHSGKTLLELSEADPNYLDWMYQEIDELRPYIDDTLEEAT